MNNIFKGPDGRIAKGKFVLYLLGIGIVSGIVKFGMSSFLGTSTSSTISPTTSSSIVTSPANAPSGYKQYQSKNLQIKALNYPATWTVSENRDDYSATFESPDKHVDVSASLYGPESEGQTYDYTSLVVKLREAMTKANIQMTNQHMEKINGQDWLVYDFSTTIKTTTYYNRQAIYILPTYENQQFIQFLLESDKAHFDADAKVFSTMLASARFY